MKAYKVMPVTPQEEEALSALKSIGKRTSADSEEFLPFVTSALERTPGNTFLKAMLQNIKECVPLTERMKEALRTMQKRESAVKDGKPIARMTVLVKKWWIAQNNLKNHVFTFNVEVETAKAYKVSGFADLGKESYCTICGRSLTELASQILGIGPVCANKNGIPYPDGILHASVKVRNAIRANIQKEIRKVQWAGWLPKSQVKEIIEYIENPEK